LGWSGFSHHSDGTRGEQAWHAANTKARELGWIVYDQPMVRITIALALAAALIVAGAFG